MLAEFDEEGREMSEHKVIMCLMMLIGLASWALIVEDWPDYTRSLRVVALAWLAFWLGPPMYFIWTKVVMG